MITAQVAEIVPYRIGGDHRFLPWPLLDLVELASGGDHLGADAGQLVIHALAEQRDGLRPCGPASDPAPAPAKIGFVGHDPCHPNADSSTIVVGSVFLMSGSWIALNSITRIGTRKRHDDEEKERRDQRDRLDPFSPLCLAQPDAKGCSVDGADYVAARQRFGNGHRYLPVLHEEREGKPFPPSFSSVTGRARR